MAKQSDGLRVCTQREFSQRTVARLVLGSGPGCSGLVQVATRDQSAGTTNHSVVVTGNDLPGVVGNVGVLPGATYNYEVVTLTSAGLEVDNNGGQCYQVTIPSAPQVSG